MMKYVLSLFLSLLAQHFFAQVSGWGDLFFEAGMHYGYTLAPEEIKSLQLRQPYGFEVNIASMNTSYERWKIFRAYNITGIHAAYFNFRSPEILGSSYLITAFTEPVIQSWRSSVLSVRAGGGFSYQTKIYHPLTDSLNKLVSTRLSFVFSLSAKYKYMLNNDAILTVSGNFNHISNGAIRIPNMGLNFPTVSIGLEYFPHGYPALDQDYTYIEEPGLSGSFIQFQAVGGFRYINDKPAGIYNFNIRYVRQLNAWYALHAGAELLLNGALKETIKIENGKADFKRYAMTFGFDFLPGRFVVTQYLGVYLYTPWKPKDPVYQRFELTYRIFPNIRTGISLKTYIGEVDFVGLTISYLLNLNTVSLKRSQVISVKVPPRSWSR